MSVHSLVLVAIAFLLLAGAVRPSHARFAPSESGVASANCARLTWKDPLTWYGGSLLAVTHNATACDSLEIRNDLYRCKVAKPVTQCSSDSQCPKDLRCGEEMSPRMCVSCDMSTIDHTWYEYENVTLNVTESMLRGQFWTKDSFYNHTGVDLILTLERWVWSPNMKVLLHDFVRQYRTTWGNVYDDDQFYTSTEAFDTFNSTHTRRRWAIASRVAFDRLDGGKVNVDGYQGSLLALRVIGSSTSRLEARRLQVSFVSSFTKY